MNSFSHSMNYAIIKLGNKQHRVRHGETLVVDRLPAEEGKSFEPVVLLGEGKVTATVLAHGRGPKILIGKYRKRTGYKRHNGFRAAVSKVEISLEGGVTPAKPAAKKRAAAAQQAPEVEAAVVEAAVVEADAAEAAPVEAAAVAEAPLEGGPVAEAPVAGEAPEGYAGMTVAQVTAAAKEWSRPELEAALAHERAHAARKGALAALESALAKEDA
jgi:large subunit ribosomal protein L21